MGTVENLRDTITPKSDQLNADDLVETALTITVTAVKRGSSAEQPVFIEYENMEGRPYKPCKSMRRVLIAAWGDDGRKWVGNKIKLYCDQEIKFGGVRVGKIRISHLSNIPSDLSVMLSTSRGKRSQYDVRKLTDEHYPQAAFDANCARWISSIIAEKLTIDKVKTECAKKAPLSETQIKYLEDRIK